MKKVINNRSTAVATMLSQRQTVSVLGMPGSGISLFLKELCKANLGHSVYIDVFGISQLTSLELFRTLAASLGVKSIGDSDTLIVKECIKRLEQLTRTKGTVIIYFAGFDQLVNVLDTSLLQHLQALARCADGKVKLVFGLCISLKKLIPDALFDSGLRLFGNRYYLKPHSSDELKYLLETYGPPGWSSAPNLEGMIKLSGGHFQLLMTLLSHQADLSDIPTKPADPLFKNLYDHLLGPQRTIVRNLAQGRHLKASDEYLQGIGMVAPHGTLFSPLFSDYLAGLYGQRLPAKEQRLFSLLKRSLGSVVPKRVIIDTVWKDSEVGSEWALNALIYRLRKHPAFVAKGYTIENHKKVGYILTKN